MGDFSNLRPLCDREMAAKCRATRSARSGLECDLLHPESCMARSATEGSPVPIGEENVEPVNTRNRLMPHNLCVVSRLMHPTLSPQDHFRSWAHGIIPAFALAVFAIAWECSGGIQVRCGIGRYSSPLAACSAPSPRASTIAFAALMRIVGILDPRACPFAPHSIAPVLLPVQQQTRRLRPRHFPVGVFACAGAADDRAAIARVPGLHGRWAAGV